MLKSATVNKWLSEITFTPQLIQEIIHWLKTNELPQHVKTEEQHHSWVRNFAEFRIQDQTLFYNNLEIIPNTPSVIRDVLTEIYKSPEALGKGINALFKYVQSIYIGIRRSSIIFKKSNSPP